MKKVTYKELQEIMFKDTILGTETPLTGEWLSETETMRLVYKNYFCEQTQEEVNELFKHLSKNG